MRTSDPEGSRPKSDNLRNPLGDSTSAYDEAADDYGGVIQANWNSAVNINGIDH